MTTPYPFSEKITETMRSLLTLFRMQIRQILGPSVRRLIVGVLVLGLIFSHSVNGAEGTKAPIVPTEQTAAILRECLDIIHKGDLKKAEENLDTVTQKFALHSYPLADAVGSELALAKNQLEEAWKYSNPYGSTLPEFKSEFLEGELAAGATLNAYNEYKPASELFDWLASNTTGTYQVMAAEGCGRSLLGLKGFDKAIESYQFALDYGRTLYNNQHQLDWILNRLPAEIAEAKHQQEIYLYGEDFVLYREGERLRRQEGAYAQAISLYKRNIDKFPNGPYADASRLYLSICLENIGKIEEADKELQAFYSANKNGLYRGEALLELTRIALVQRLDFPLASKYCVLLDTWIKNARMRAPSPLPSIKEAAKIFTIAPVHQKRRSQWGIIEPIPIVPGEVVNEATCTWYLNSLEASCVKIGGFLLLCENKTKLAEAQFTRLKAVDPECAIESIDGDKAQNDYSRLMWAAKNGYFYAMPEELSQYKDNQKVAILLADFFMVTQEFELAKNLYKRMLVNDIGILTSTLREYPMLGYATCIYSTEGSERGYEEYSKLLTSGGKTFTKMRAMFYAANAAQHCKNEAYRANGISILRDLVCLNPDSKWVLQGKVLYAEILLDDNKSDEGIALLNSIPKSAGDYWELANYLKSRATEAIPQGSVK